MTKVRLGLLFTLAVAVASLLTYAIFREEKVVTLGQTLTTTSTQPTYTFSFSEGGYTHGSFQVSEITNTTFIFQGTNSSQASSTEGSTVWTNITSDIAASSSIGAVGYYFLDTDMVFNKVRLLFTTSTGQATSSVYATFAN